MQWHQLDHMQTISTSLQTDNHTDSSSLNFTGRVLFMTPNQQRQSTEGKMKPVYQPKNLKTRLVTNSAYIYNSNDRSSRAVISKVNIMSDHNIARKICT